MNSSYSLQRKVVLVAEPTAMAMEVIRQAGVTEWPVRFEDILPKFGKLTLVQADLTAAGYLLEFPDGTGEIVYATPSTKSRRWRFTVAHELGHWITHQYAEKGPLNSFRQGTTEEVEKWCDRFAEALLLPEAWIRRFANATGNRLVVINEGPGAFDTSRSAFEGRLVTTLRLVALRTTDNGGVEVPPILRAHKDEINEAVGFVDTPPMPGTIHRFAVSGRPYVGVWVGHANHRTQDEQYETYER